MGIALTRTQEGNEVGEAIIRKTWVSDGIWRPALRSPRALRFSAVLTTGRPFISAMELSSAFVALALYLAGAEILFKSLSGQFSTKWPQMRGTKE